MDLRTLHTRFLVDDYRASFLFYREILGLTPSFGNEDSGYADFAVGDSAFSLFDRREMFEALSISEPATSQNADTVTLIIGVPDVDAAAAELRSKGVTLVSEPEDRADWGIRTAHFRDPSGTLVEINAPLKSPQH